MSETGNLESAAPDLDDLPPLAADRLPPQARKHVDPASAVPLRMMGAKGLVPLTPPDVCRLLSLAVNDPDQEVARTARATAEKLPDKILGVALREESLEPQVLDFLATALAGRHDYLELLVGNIATADATVARLAVEASPALAETIARNQIRLLRDERILRGLCANPNIARAVLDDTCDFAVRSGIVMDDLDAMRAARVRVYGEQPPPLPTEQQQHQLEQEVIAAVADAEKAPEDAEAQGRPMASWSKMSVAQKIRAASFKAAAFRKLALRDPNKLVAMAAINSPKLTDSDVELVAMSRAVDPDVLRVVYSNREMHKNYQIRIALAKNPRVPLSVAIRFLQLLRENDIKVLMSDRNVPAGVRQQAKALIQSREKPSGGGARH